MKRARENGEAWGFDFDIFNCLMWLSGQGLETKPKQYLTDVFECKTCHRRFPSFQALGGHRASHKKPRLMGQKASGFLSLATNSKPKTKMHECVICGQKFPVGQALGGHMRRHRAAMNESQSQSRLSSFPIVSKTPAMERSNGASAVCMDLNLTPLENDLENFCGKMKVPFPFAT